MKKLRLLVLMLFVCSASVLMVACGDPNLPKYYEVNFNTGVNGFTLNKITVKEGYSINYETDISTLEYPNPSKIAIFDGWFSDSAFKNPWNMNTYRVTSNTTLYAKWLFPSQNPSEVKIGSEAFSKSITWLQTDVEEDDISIQVIKGDNMYYDSRRDEWLPGNTYTYNSAPIAVAGTVDIDGYNVKFTPTDNIEGGNYQVIISTDITGVEDVRCNDIYFKGSGTELDPYLIYSENDLKYLTTKSVDNGIFVELKKDVSLKSLYSEKVGCVFNGSFNGNNHTITLKNNSGLFYELGELGEVFKVKFSGAISGSDPSMGVVANYNSGYIHDCDSTSVSVVSQGGVTNNINTISKGGVGGIVGTNLQKGKITNCTITSGQANVISGKIAVGGIAGINYGRIYNMTSSAIVAAYNGNENSATIGNSFSGIAVGVNYGEVFQVNCDGKINCRRIDKGKEGDGATNVGGVVGYNAQGGIINECLFQGMRCVGDTNVGGIAGYNDGTIKNCFTGRRVRKPSNTTLAERQFISPVIGSYNVGGIAGKIGTHSVITNVFSTANVWAYGSRAYSVAEKADNAIGVKYNQNPRTASTYLGQKYGVVLSNELLAPTGENVIFLDNSDRVGTVINNLLGTKYVNGRNVEDNALIRQYLTHLGNKFGYNSTYGISLLWQSVNTKDISYYGG